MADTSGVALIVSAADAKWPQSGVSPGALWTRRISVRGFET